MGGALMPQDKIPAETERERLERIRYNLEVVYRDASQSERDAYIASERVAPSGPAKKDDPTFSLLDRIGAGAQTFSDASTFGLAGLVDDALTSAATRQTFADTRSARRAARDDLPSSVRTGLELAGALATPLPGAGAMKGVAMGAKGVLSPTNTLLRLAPQKGLIRGAVASGAEAAAQAGLEGTVRNLDDLSIEGLGDALQSGKRAATVGALVAAPLGGATGMLTRVKERVGRMGDLDKQAFAIVDDMAKLDAVNYTAARGEAKSTPAIKAVLDSRTVNKYAKIVRESEEFHNADDATVLMEAYKLMSRAEGKSIKSIEGTAEHLADVEMQARNIKFAKPRMLAAAEGGGQVVVPGRAVNIAPPTTAQSPPPSLRQAMDDFSGRSAEAYRRNRPDLTPQQQSALDMLRRRSAEGVVTPPLSGAPKTQRLVTRPSETIDIDPGIPSLRKAIDAHRVKSGELGALQKGSDISLSVASGKHIRGEKLTVASKEAFLREIPEMTKEEATAALAGVLGRVPEQFRLTSSPLGLFGLVTSAVRAPLTSYRTAGIVEALEKQAGISSKSEGFANLIRGATARAAGQPEDRRGGR